MTKLIQKFDNTEPTTIKYSNVLALALSDERNLSDVAYFKYRTQMAEGMPKPKKAKKYKPESTSNTAVGLTPADIIYDILKEGIKANWVEVPNRGTDMLGKVTDVTYHLLGNVVVAVGDTIELEWITANTAVVVCRNLIVRSGVEAKYLSVLADTVSIHGHMQCKYVNITASDICIKAKSETVPKYYCLNTETRLAVDPSSRAAIVHHKRIEPSLYSINGRMIQRDLLSELIHKCFNKNLFIPTLQSSPMDHHDPILSYIRKGWGNVVLNQAKDKTTKSYTEVVQPVQEPVIITIDESYTEAKTPEVTPYVDDQLLLTALAGYNVATLKVLAHCKGLDDNYLPTTKKEIIALLMGFSYAGNGFTQSDLNAAIDIAKQPEVEEPVAVSADADTDATTTA